MHKKFSIFCLSILFLLVACSADSKNFNYSGKTDLWKGELKVTQDSSGNQTEKFSLEYKGENVDSVGPISFLVESVGSFGKRDVTLNEDGTITTSSTANPTNAKVTEETQVEVTVEWSGNSETFELSKY